MWEIGLLMIPEDDENTAVMQYFMQQFKTFTQSIKMFPVTDLLFEYGKHGNYVDNYWFSKNWWQNYDKIAYNCLFNNYPKEWLITEISSYPLKKYDFMDLNSIEPWWKILLGNKALLPLLWAHFPNHPNLLPTYYDEPK